MKAAENIRYNDRYTGEESWKYTQNKKGERNILQYYT
jgi:hypothetical protein